MIHALDKNSEYLIRAQWFKREDIIQKLTPGQQSLTEGGVFFRCKLVNSIAQDGDHPVKNLYAAGESMVVETLFNIGVQVNDYVFVNGKWWLVNKVYVAEIDNKEKTLGIMRLNYSNKKTTLDLVETHVQ